MINILSLEGHTSYNRKMLLSVALRDTKVILAVSKPDTTIVTLSFPSEAYAMRNYYKLTRGVFWWFFLPTDLLFI